MPKNCSTCRAWVTVTAERAREGDYLGDWAIGHWGECNRAAFNQPAFMYTEYLEDVDLTFSEVYCPNWTAVSRQEEPQCTCV